MQKFAMAYKIPSNELVVGAIISCMSSYGIINSQRKLGELVRKKVKETEHLYQLSDERIRRLAVSNHLVELELRYKEAGEGKLPHKCPICGSKLKRLKNMTIDGGTVTLGYACQTCRYWTGLRRNVPARYVFTSRR